MPSQAGGAAQRKRGALGNHHPRTQALAQIQEKGVERWKKDAGYHRRSLAETAMSRLKRLGERLAARDPARQVAEVQIRCAILNTFNALGMPDTIVRA